MLAKSKTNGVVLALLPPLNIYLVTRGFTLATVLVLISVAYSIFKKGVLRKGCGLDLFLFISVFVLGFISFLFSFNEEWYNSELYIHNQFSIFVTFLAFVYLLHDFNDKSFLLTVELVALLAAVLCLYQLISIIVFGYFTADLYLPFFEVTREAETISGLRPCAFFTEPAHVSMYLAPAALYLFNEKKYFLGFVLILGLLSTSSTTGVLVTMLVIFCVVANNGFSLKNIFIFSIGIIAIILLFVNYFPFLIEFGLSKMEGTDAQSDMRLLGTFVYYPYFELDNIVFGIGLNQLESFAIFKRGSLAFDGSGNYANSMIYMLFCYGVLGFIVILIYLYGLLKKNKKNVSFFLILLSILFSDQILFAPALIYLIAFIYAKKDYYYTN